MVVWFMPSQITLGDELLKSLYIWETLLTQQNLTVLLLLIFVDDHNLILFYFNLQKIVISTIMKIYCNNLLCSKHNSYVFASLYWLLVVKLFT